MVMKEEKIKELRKDFPLIEKTGVIYLDNAATMQKLRAVLDAMRHYNEEENANALRGLHDLSVRATKRLAETRQKVKDWLGAGEEGEIILTRNATEGLNLVARGWHLNPEDEVVVGLGEHHSNLLPWVKTVERQGAKLKLAKVTEEGVLTLEQLRKLLTKQTKVVALSAMSNVTGRRAEVEELIRLAKTVRAMVVVDAAQAVAHERWRVGEADFVVFSGHKIGAPMGVGVLYGLKRWLKIMEPMNYGGEMVTAVEERDGEIVAEWAELPAKFEAGTINVEGAVGLSAALDYWQKQNAEELYRYVEELTEYARRKITEIPKLKLLSAERGIISFKIEGVHAHDVAEILNREGIAVRAGYHCAQPFLEGIGFGVCVRASLGIYNTRTEIEKMIEVLSEVRMKMGLR